MQSRDFMFYEDYYVALKSLVNSGRQTEADEILKEIICYGVTRERTKEHLLTVVGESIFRQCKTKIDISDKKRSEQKEMRLRREESYKEKNNGTKKERVFAKELEYFPI